MSKKVCIRPCGCFTCPYPDCICDDPPNRTEKRLSEMIDRDPGRWDAEAKSRERERAKAREYYHRNREKVRARQTKYYKENQERIQAYGRSLYQYKTKVV